MLLALACGYLAIGVALGFLMHTKAAPDGSQPPPGISERLFIMVAWPWPLAIALGLAPPLK